MIIIPGAILLNLGTITESIIILPTNHSAIEKKFWFR